MQLYIGGHFLLVFHTFPIVLMVGRAQKKLNKIVYKPDLTMFFVQFVFLFSTTQMTKQHSSFYYHSLPKLFLGVISESYCNLSASLVDLSKCVCLFVTSLCYPFFFFFFLLLCVGVIHFLFDERVKFDFQAFFNHINQPYTPSGSHSNFFNYY